MPQSTLPNQLLCERRPPLAYHVDGEETSHAGAEPPEEGTDLEALHERQAPGGDGGGPRITQAHLLFVVASPHVLRAQSIAIRREQ